jgi:hypothetical protein
VTGLLFLVALPTFLVRLVPLGAGQPVHLEPLQDSPHPGLGDLDLVVALEIHRDLQWAEVVVLAQVHDLADDLLGGGVGAVMRALGSVA